MRALALALAVAACGRPPPAPDPVDLAARATYPDLAALYQADHGLYRGCGPNGGVCHNGNEFPNLASLGSIVANIGVRCNQKRGAAVELDDLCEQPGDRVELGGEKIELAYLEPYAGMPSVGWRMKLRRRPARLAPTGEQMQVWRAVPDGRGGTVDAAFAPLGAALAGYLPDPDDATGRSILLALPQNPGNDPALGALIDLVIRIFSESGTGRPDRLQFGDANRDGTFGAELGGRLIKPGDPERSYLLRRLTDPTSGPLMPRANCCAWTRASLRALWCWVDGLAPDGANAGDAIDYDRCRPSPAVELLYPEPGPMCEAQGRCPVQAGGGTGDATFASIYGEILTARCAGAGCHDTGDPGGVDLRSRDAAFATLSARVVPRDPEASVLWNRLEPARCQGACKTMPLDRPALTADERARIRQWIVDGAADD